MKMYELIYTAPDGTQSAHYYENKGEATNAADVRFGSATLTPHPVNVVKCFILDIDHMGQKSGAYYQSYIPAFLVMKRDGLLWLRIENVHKSGYITPAGMTLLYTDEEQAQRAALS